MKESREPAAARREWTRAGVLVLLAVLAGLITDALRGERVFFARPAPVFRSLPASR